MTLSKLFLSIALTTTLAACASQSHNHGTVSGSADLAAFFELPSDAVFEATLNDESATDESARQLGQARLEPAGLPPFRFAIDFDRNLIDARHRYTVSARVLSGGQTMLATRAGYPVLTQGGSNKVELLLAQP
jgi:uncharacterized lipoprotein YbaY